MYYTQTDLLGSQMTLEEAMAHYFYFHLYFSPFTFWQNLESHTSQDLLCVIKADNFLAHHKIEDSICIFSSSLPNATIVHVLTKPFHESSNSSEK